MSDYTPTTEEVRNQYSGFSTSNSNHTGQVYLNFAEFDRWLAEVKAQAVADDRAQLLAIAKGNLRGCSGYGCDECESVMFIDDIVVQRQIRSGEEQ